MPDTVHLILPVVCLALDLIPAEPRFFPHPVRMIGRTINALEGVCRSAGEHVSLKQCGCLAVIVLSLSVGCAVYYLCQVPWIGFIPAVYFGWSGLALGELVRECRRAHYLIMSGDLTLARQAVGMLVSRDVSAMDMDTLRRSLAETLSENFNDAFVAPFFYLTFFGPAGLWFYKVVSTFDSMWGYKSDKWRELGAFGARADDVLAFIPARLSFAFMCLGAVLLRRFPYGKLGKMITDARKTESPNAGWPMSAAAWVCNAGMGGTYVYHGQAMDKPRLGPETAEWSDAKLSFLSRFILICGIIGALLLSGTIITINLTIIRA